MAAAAAVRRQGSKEAGVVRSDAGLVEEVGLGDRRDDHPDHKEDRGSAGELVLVLDRLHNHLQGGVESGLLRTAYGNDRASPPPKGEKPRSNGQTVNATVSFWTITLDAHPPNSTESAPIAPAHPA